MSQESKSQLKLYLRLRPFTPFEQNYSKEEQKGIIIIDSENEINIESTRKFVFDKIFKEETPEQEIFLHSTANIINNAFNGNTCSIICYGSCCTGKSTTLEQIISNTMKEIFKSDISKYTLNISFMEYYLNEWTDLLNKKTNLSINNDTIKDLTMLNIDSLKEFNELYSIGKKNRVDLHQKSTKYMMTRVFYSHSILILNIFKDNTLFGKIFFIDLGGSSGAISKNISPTDIHLKEITSLNNSINNFEQAIKSLSKKQKCTFRQDKFLRVIKQCFDNDCYLSFIIHCANLKMYKRDIMKTLEISKYIKNIYI